MLRAGSSAKSIARGGFSAVSAELERSEQWVPPVLQKILSRNERT